MKTLAQVRTALIHDAVGEFTARLEERVAQGTKTPEQRQAYLTRLERARLLALAPGMMQQTQPGWWDVWSTGKDLNTVYTVGKSCNCPDADLITGKAPQGWCKHRLACFLALAADRGVKILEARMEGLKLPHTHTYACGHADLEACYSHECLTAQEETVCSSCAPHDVHVDDAQRQREDAIFGTDAATVMDELDPCPQAVIDLVAPLDPPAQYEVPSPVVPKLAPLPEAPASLNLKFKKGQCEFMVTMRAHTDQEILARLPAMLKGLRDQLGITFTQE